MMQNSNTKTRRQYWRESMDLAYQFMLSIMDYPVEECSEPLASLEEAAKEANVEVVFSSTKINGQLDRIFYLREGLINSFIAIGKEMNHQGWVLKVEDAYRTVAMQKQLTKSEKLLDKIIQKVLWELDGAKPDQELLFKRLSALIATCPKIGTHTSASAIDMSVLDRDTLDEIDRGAPYLEMSELTPMNSPFVSERAQQNRQDITSLMAKHGFVAYPYEFWHYSSGDAYDQFINKTGKPAIYGPVNRICENGSNVEAIENPTAPLQEPQEFRQTAEAALARIAGISK